MALCLLDKHPENYALIIGKPLDESLHILGVIVVILAESDTPKPL